MYLFLWGVVSTGTVRQCSDFPVSISRHAVVRLRKEGRRSILELFFPPQTLTYILTAMHATLTARNFFLANFYPSGPFTCIFSKTSPSQVFPVLSVANTGSCVGPQNKIGHPSGCRLQC